MNQIEACEKMVDSLLVCLGLPVESGAQGSERQAEIVDARISVMFPNLSSQERAGIMGAHLARAAAKLAYAAQQETLSGELQNLLAAIAVDANASHQKALDALDQYGLRAKLTDFQETLFSHLCNRDGRL